MTDMRRSRASVPAPAGLSPASWTAVVVGLLLMVSGIGCGGDGGNEAENLAPNPSFEQGVDGSLDAWSPVAPGIVPRLDPSEKTHGERSLVVEGDSVSEVAWTATIPEEKLPEGQTVYLRVKAKLAGQAGGKPGPAFVRLSFAQSQEGGAGKLLGVAGRWERLDLSAQVPSGAQGAVIKLGIDKAVGKAWFDEVWVGTTPPPGRGVPGWLVAGVGVLGLIGGGCCLEKRRRRNQQRLREKQDAERRASQEEERRRDLLNLNVLKENMTKWQNGLLPWDWVATPGATRDLPEMLFAGRAFRALHRGLAALAGAAPRYKGGAAPDLENTVAEGLQMALRANGVALREVLEDARQRVMPERSGLSRAEEDLQGKDERVAGLEDELKALGASGTYAARVDAVEASVEATSAAVAELIDRSGAADAPNREVPACLGSAQLLPAGEGVPLAERIRERARELAASAPDGEADDRYRNGLLAEGGAGIARRLAGAVDALEAAAYRVSVRDFHRRHGSFVKLRRALAAKVLPLLEAAPEDEAARHYHRALSELLEQFDMRLARAREDVDHPGQSLAGTEDLDVRIERLRARADRLKEGDPAYLEEQAKPSVQEHLRPLVDMLVRDFLGPLLQEAAPVAGESGASARKMLGEVVAAARKVLAETIELKLIEPEEGGEILETEHEEVDVLSPIEGAEANTVAAVVEPGYRWAGELIARARVRSYR